MKRVLTAIILIPLILIAIFRAPIWVLTGMVAVFALLAAYEFLEICKGYGVRPFKWFTLVLLALLFVPFEMLLPQYARIINFGYIALTVLAPFLMLALAMSRKELREGLPAAALSLIALPYIGIGLGATLIPVKSLPFGNLLITFLLIVVWSGDIFAYYVGKNLGRRKMAPNISPNKTWEGAVASLVGSAALGTFFLANAPAVWAGLTRMHFIAAQSVLGTTIPVHAPAEIWKVIMMALVINIAAQVGDLVESMIKRGANVKDSGRLLPGHGGVLDRVDALLFAAPVGVLLFIIINLHLAR